ncbi:hypothetical protein ASD11_10145 [Aeromicrobium sp. Root495]|uniref:MGMT family protein n=1 Tax=Aeromicrobium sp. Root495 TaxID=1736550 RepID=UPI0006F3135D|nr:MGMT family protein [Aeromicrobium sp. Root495]KQY59870.1 hypothetical protein ASD11_10145 [Aeromicrobium sp. Root495]
MPDESSTLPLPGGGHAEPPDRLSPFQQHVVEVVEAIAPGELVTYGEVALEAGHPGAAQAVANVLRRVPGLPWWRVLPEGGRLYHQHREVAAPLLRAEGHRIDETGRVHPVDSTAR